MSELLDLAAFVESLEDSNIISFDITSFDDRIRLQKYVYLAKKMGLDFPYNFNLYIHGPYSKELADDYYKLDSIKRKLTPMQLPEDFIEFLQGKDTPWLEVAATTVFMMERNPEISDEKLVLYVKIAKGFAEEDTILGIKQVFS